MNKAVQQTLIDYTEPVLAKEGIKGYNFPHPELSDSEERKANSNNSADSLGTLGLILWPLMVVEADPGALPNAFETRAKRRMTSHQPSARDKSPVTPEEGPGVPTTPGVSHVNSPLPNNPDHDTDPRKGIGVALHPGK